MARGFVSDLGDRLAAIAFCFFAEVIPYTPLWLIRGVSVVMFVLMYPVAGYLLGLERRFARHIRIAFEEDLTPRDSRRLARRALYELLIDSLEINHYYHPRNIDELLRNVPVEGLEKIHRALEGGRGAVGAAAHLGNFQLLAIRLSKEEFNFSFLVKDPKNPHFAKAWYKYMDTIPVNRINFVSRVSAAKGAFRALGRGDFVMMVADEFKRRGGVEVNFFGKTTMLAAGPAAIALKTGAPMLPINIFRGKKSCYRVVVDDQIEFAPTGDVEKDIRNYSQLRTDIMERYVREYPHELLWTHDRWKKRRR
ncbi:MAG: lysophospholipid acyltransferase family protein [Deltaproteobacteria bacterium]|nr:lysophospholipid acyltransferase family protein [Candidatus Zymogenaceae bacterium]